MTSVLSVIIININFVTQEEAEGTVLLPRSYAIGSEFTKAHLKRCISQRPVSQQWED